MLTNREKVIDFLKSRSESLSATNKLGVSAKAISDELQIQRSTVSLYLNDLVRNGEALKINTRPVYFIDAAIYEKNKSNLPNIQKYLHKAKAKKHITDPFHQLVGESDSLKGVVEQMKSAVIYPPNGMPSLLMGDSGVGKSFIAKLAYLYAKEQGYVSGEFVTLNCAEYADNPELLSSMLFGHTKGAFTGAQDERQGLLASAQNGYLFLDEVHRLAPESQEKLFQFMDKGTYRPVGETSKVRKSNARLIFATTERNNVDFLQTFLRRIPLVIQIPSYQERTKKEKIALITSLFMKEAKLIQRNLTISSEAVCLLITQVKDGNIGKLGSIVKLACAESLLKHRDDNTSGLLIKINDLPASFLTDQKQLSELPTNKDETIKIDFTQNVAISATTSQQVKLQDYAKRIIAASSNLDATDEQRQEFFNKISKIVDQLSDYISFDLGRSQPTAFAEFIESTIKTSLANFYLNFGMNQFNSNADLLTKIILFINDYENDQEIEGLTESNIKIKSFYSERYELAEQVVQTIGTQLDVQKPDLYKLLVFGFIFSQRKQLIPRDTNAVIVAHGYSTASSIATTVNRLLGTFVFASFDMPLDAGVNAVVSELKRYFNTINTEKELIILVDMGSLTKLQSKIQDFYDGTIGIMTNVSTASALFVGQKVLKNEVDTEGLQQIAEQTSAKSNVLVQQKRPKVILTTCITGIGAAKYLQKVVQDNTNGEINVVTCDYYELKRDGKQNSIFKDYNVKVIIGTDDPDITDVPYLSVESLINREVGDRVLLNAFPDVFNNKNLENMNTAMVRAFTIDSIASNLAKVQPDITIDQVEHCVKVLERSLGSKMDVYLRISLYMHLCFMLDRIVDNHPNMDYHNLQQFKKEHQQFIKVVKDAFSEIEHYYKVTVPTSEIGFVYDILKNRISLKSMD
ncbi:sigma 54-interacting transcriptional regulator [Pediococcus argentinicus]|uniref:Transcriptional regulator n=1 Tax=Pediococcus argentinicus TaxID=480391 RepID=A0A0R2NLE0_9LACO|nr:sigma 54-interacting transcriptional regulator [Pediococcus argentinicus]KRO25451.1 transcriptional regulator [Pediococcus argentinicus]NKZ22217.1 sigma 54-interacting transcriptional regulator [Pediococcus argentinicus]GEP19314.1 transcription antiterminator BglG [Pediococcus argentinicus]